MKYLLSFLICFFFLPMISQDDHSLDSLKQALKLAKHDTTRLAVLCELSETAPDGEWEGFNQEMLELAEKK